MQQMQTKTVETLSSLILAVGVGTGAVATISPATAQAVEMEHAPLSMMAQRSGPTSESTQGRSHASCTEDFVHTNVVAGDFSYQQDALTSRSDLANVFLRAASSVCASLPVYSAQALGLTVSIGGDADQTFYTTVRDLAETQGTETHVMACACSSNVEGGGAIANAHVEGISLASLYHKALN